MPSVASFSAALHGSLNYFYISGIFDSSEIMFLFDTGATYSTIGVNSFFKGDGYEDEKQEFINLLTTAIDENGVLKRPGGVKTATEEIITTYPCISHGVSLQGMPEIDFYFDICPGNFGRALLGTSFSHECVYHHTMMGNISITAMKDDVGKSFYTGYKVLEFDSIVDKFIKAYPDFA